MRHNMHRFHFARSVQPRLAPTAFLLSLAASVGMAQTGTAGIQGVVLDAKTLKPIATAWVMANRSGPPPFVKRTKSGSDGAFQIQGLTAGTYSLCVQAAGDQYLDPCQWNGSPTTVTLVSGQNAAGLSLKVAPASILNILVQDPQQALSQKTRDGRRPDLTLGVWGPKGTYYPAHAAGGQSAALNLPGNAIRSYSYRLAVPPDTALKVHIASHDLKIGDAAGLSLPGNASQQAFQHATGDPNPKSLTFTVLGLLP
jgi:hypothetical protein